MSQDITDTYTLAIVTSAFQCLDHHYAGELLAELNNRITVEGRFT